MCSSLRVFGKIVALTVLGASNVDAAIWGVKTEEPVSQPPSTLFHFAENGTDFTVVGSITLEGTPVDIDALALSRAGALVAFEIGETGSRLVSIDATTAEAAPIGQTLPERECRGATFADDGRLIVLDAATDEALILDESTGTIVGSPVPLLEMGSPFDLGSITDLVDTGGGIFLISSGRDIYEMDLASGAVTFVYTDSVPGPDTVSPGPAGLALSREETTNGQLFSYDIQFNDDIFVYEDTVDWLRTLLYEDIIPSYNAGRGDLAAAPPEVSGIGTGEIPNPSLRLQGPYPNPTRDTARLRLSSATGGVVDAEVFDARGRRVIALPSRLLREGPTERPQVLDLDASGLGPGIYWIRVAVSGGSSVAVPWTVLR